jgi:hypothetical protein
MPRARVPADSTISWANAAAGQSKTAQMTSPRRIGVQPIRNLQGQDFRIYSGR